MHNQSEESAFARFFLWMAVVKTTMGLFFIFFVFLYLLLGLVSAGPVMELGFFGALEMGFAAFFVGLAQQLLLPDGGDCLTPVRGVLWVAATLGITLAFTLAFQWFAGFPLWCPVAFIAFTAIGSGAMLYRHYLQLQRETRQLNRRLEQFQKQKK